MGLPRLRPRKLLLATAGLASVSYIGCGTNLTSGNLPAPPPCDGGGYACYNPPDAGVDAARDASAATDAPTE
jgi:hypothetical protein